MAEIHYGSAHHTQAHQADHASGGGDALAGSFGPLTLTGDVKFDDSGDILGVNANFASGFIRLSYGTDAGAGSGSSSFDIQSIRNAGRTGLDLIPTSGTLPTTLAYAELVLYRTVTKTTNYERLNFSAMANPADGGYRIGQEFAGTGARRDIFFAQEAGVTAGTEVYLAVTSRDGDSQRIEIRHGHLEFTVASMGGLGTSYYIGRGGGSTFGYNVPAGASHQWFSNNVRGMDLTGGVLGIGEAGTTLGVLTLSGNTSGTITIRPAATAGIWTLTLPPDDGDVGEQLQTNGSGVTTWEAAASSEGRPEK